MNAAKRGQASWVCDNGPAQINMVPTEGVIRGQRERGCKLERMGRETARVRVGRKAQQDAETEPANRDNRADRKGSGRAKPERGVLTASGPKQ